MVLRFHGGVHPPGGKARTEKSPITALAVPKQAVIPLVQHIGAPAKAVVKVGDVVKKGQLIGEAGGFVSAAVHASIGGEVKRIAPHPHRLGVPVETVTIEGNGDEEWAEGTDVERDVSTLDADAIRAAVADAGIVGMGGATFPTHVKLSPPKNKPIDTLILNGVECEPCLTADDRLMVEAPEKVLDGGELMRRALGCERLIVAIEQNKPEAIDLMTKAVARRENVSVASLRVRYPQGAEKQLIQALLGREVPSGGLPLDVGVVVQNVATSAAVDDAVRFSRPLIERVLTVTGEKAAECGNFRVRVGTLFADILEHVGVEEGMNRLILGGPMMGLAQPSADVAVTKGTSGILLTRDVARPPSLACIRCGRCVDVCPSKLTPSRLSTLLEADLIEEAAEWNLADCIECGCCAYVCPSMRPIVQQVKYGKAELNRRKTKDKMPQGSAS